MSFLTDKYKGIYRIKAPYDQNNDFPRDYKGMLGDLDEYIDGQAAKVYYYGNNTLEAYTKTVNIGRNMVKNIYDEYIGDVNKYITVTENVIKGETKQVKNCDYDSLYKDEKLNKLIYNIIETDAEMYFKFKNDDMDKLAKFFKLKTSGAGISPLSSKNLPKCKYEILEQDDKAYKDIMSKLPKTQYVKISSITVAFLKTLANKRNTYDNMKATMKKECLNNKSYIHSIGKWEEYLKFFNAEIDKLLAE